MWVNVWILKTYITQVTEYQTSKAVGVSCKLVSVLMDIGRPIIQVHYKTAKVAKTVQACAYVWKCACLLGIESENFRGSERMWEVRVDDGMCL